MYEPELGQSLKGDEQTAPAEIEETETAEGADGDAHQQEADTDASLNESGEEGEDQLSPVPYSRFAEVNGKYRDLEKTALPKATEYDELRAIFEEEVPGLRETLASGVPLPKALRDIAAANARRNQQIQQISVEVAQDHAKVDAALERGEVTDEWAAWAKDQITATHHAKPQIAETQEQQVRQRVESMKGAILKEYPESDPDMIADYLLVGKGDIARQRAELQHTKVIKAREAAEAKAATAVADYEAANAKRSTTTQPERGNSKVAEKPSKVNDILKMSDAEFLKYMQTKGRETDLARSQ